VFNCVAFTIKIAVAVVLEGLNGFVIIAKCQIALNTASERQKEN
jgi:hypothetical protein